MAVCASMLCGILSGQAAGDAGHPGIREAGTMYLRQLQRRDSVLIADQLEYGFRMDGMKAGTEIWLPEFKDRVCDSVEIVSQWQSDTLKVNRKDSTIDMETYLVVTSFDEGQYRLPDIAVRCINPDGSADTLVFRGLDLDVKTIPVDTSTFEVHDIRGQIRYPLTFREMLPYLAGLVLFAGLVALAVWLIRKYRKHSEEEARKEPAYIVALKRIEKYRSNRYWAPDRQKQFYSGVTDALREYMAARFGVGAMEMTTSEIFGALKQEGDIPKDVFEEAKALFETSDFVKFAKMTAPDEENVKAVPAAIRFVTSTYKAEEDEADVMEKTPADDPSAEEKAAENNSEAETSERSGKEGENVL